MKTLTKVLKATVPGAAGLMKGLTLSVVIVGLFFLNSYAGDAEDLIEAAKKGDTATVKALLDKGVDVNAKDNDGWTALMWASKNGHTEIVNLLKAAGAKE